MKKNWSMIFLVGMCILTLGINKKAEKSAFFMNTLTK